MAPRKQRVEVASDAKSPLTSTSTSTASTSLASDPLPTVTINPYNLNEIKSSLDDAIRQYLTNLSFTPSQLHPTVHLTLGYTSTLLALGSTLYSLRVEFEDSKPVLWVAVIGYTVLQSLLWAWKRWVEKGEVFRGRRRRIVKRIETDHIQIISSTTLDAPPPPQLSFSPHTRPTSPSSPALVSPATLSPSNSSPQIAQTQSGSPARLSVPNEAGVLTTGPTYMIQLTLSTTSNNGKSLLRKSRVVAGKYVGGFVDVEGGVEEGEVGRWLGGLLSEAGLVGAEEVEGVALGVKEE